MKVCPQCGKTYDDASGVCSDDNSTLTFLRSDPNDPMVGKLLDGKYRLVEKVGEGGMGSIYRAVHTEMGRTCAIKLLTAVSPGREDALARFKREAKMASSIDSPHAVTIYDFGASEDGTMFLAMEFIDGKPLSKIIAAERPLPLERVVKITSQIAEGLTAAHALGIIHRDLKPDNVMLTRKSGESDYVKVLDFGIAKTVAEDASDNLTKTGFVLGTPVYMSPEQLLGEKLDPRSDIYSLAIIVYEMLSGRLPFEGDNPQSVMMKRIMAEPIRLRNFAPKVSENIEIAVMEGLAREPNTRTPTVEAFAAGLRSAMMGQTQALGGRVTGKIEDGGGTQQWSVIQTRPDSGVAQTEYAQSQGPIQRPTAQPSAQPQTSASGGESQFHNTKPEAEPRPPSVHVQPQIADTRAAAFSEVSGQAPDKRGRSLLYAGGVLLLLGIGLGVYLINPFGGGKIRLTVRGAPSRAAVYLNDKLVGDTGADGTLTLSNVEDGAQLTLKRDGFSEFTAVLKDKPTGGSIEARMLPLEINQNGQMALVDAGPFEMGSDTDEADQRPAHTVNLPAFYIDQYEVTNLQYKQFCDATKHNPPPNPQKDPHYFEEKPDYPVLGIEFEDAQSYARWAGKRLPTEDEWEKAAGWDPVSNKKRRYPWGDTANVGYANIKTDQPSKVGANPKDKSAYGVYDMAGNAWEWVDSTWGPYAGSKDWVAQPEQATDSVVRGSIFLKVAPGGNVSDPARVSARNHLPRKFPEGMSTAVGIRCAISADDPRIQEAIAARNR